MFDWDTPLLQAIAKISNTNTTTEYHTCLSAMLEELHDPVTTITTLEKTKQSPANDSEQPYVDVTTDSIFERKTDFPFFAYRKILRLLKSRITSDFKISLKY